LNFRREKKNRETTKKAPQELSLWGSRSNMTTMIAVCKKPIMAQLLCGIYENINVKDNKIEIPRDLLALSKI
jgi:hypothetical protein